MLVTRKVKGTVSPASTPLALFLSVGVPATLSTTRPVAVLVTTRAEDGPAAAVVPVGVRPEAVAVLVTAPASTSAWVIVYEAVQVVVAPGASVVVGQPTGPVFGSATATSVRVTAPGLVRVKRNVTVSPASTRPLLPVSTGVSALLARVSAAAAETGVEVVEAADPTGAPAGVRPLAVALFTTAPASTSAWVMV